MIDIELHYIETLKKECLQNGTWAEPITSLCQVEGLIETTAKVRIFYFFVK